MVCSLLPAVIGNILNVQCGSLRGHRCYILYLWWAVISNVQKSTVSRKPRNSMVKLRPHLLEFVSYSVWRRRIGRKDEIQKNAKEVFYALVPFHLEERLAFVCVQRTHSTRLFHSPMLVSVER